MTKSPLDDSALGSSAAPDDGDQVDTMNPDRAARPLFSVIIPTYNRADLVVRAVTSVLQQSEEGVEVVVVDDGSTDETKGAVASITDSRVRYVRLDRGGAPRARNQGAARAGGKFVIFLDSDDEALPGWLAAFRAEVSEHVAVVSCGAWQRFPDGRQHEIGAIDYGYVAPSTKLLFLSGTYALDAQLFERIGGFDEGLRSAQQTDIAFRVVGYVAARSQAQRYIPQPLVIHHHGSRHSIRRDDRAVLEGAIGIIEAHRDVLRRSPTKLANFHSVAGMAAIRLGEVPTARVHFLRAARVRPRDIKRWLRLGVAWLPGGPWLWRHRDIAKRGRT